MARYGHRWTSQFGERPVGAASAEWADTLASLTHAQLTHGFSVDALRGEDWPPSSTRFRAMCLPETSDAPRTWLGPQAAKVDRGNRIENERSKIAARETIMGLCRTFGVRFPDGPDDDDR